MTYSPVSNNRGGVDNFYRILWSPIELKILLLASAQQFLFSFFYVHFIRHLILKNGHFSGYFLEKIVKLNPLLLETGEYVLGFEKILLTCY